MGIFLLFQTILNKFTKNMLVDKEYLNNGKYYTEVIVFSDDDYNGKIEDRSYILNSILPYHASFKEVENRCISTAIPSRDSIKHTIRLRYHPVDRTSTFADEQGNPISDRVIDDILRPTNDDFLFVKNIDGTLSIFNLKTNEFYYNNKFIIDNDYYNNISINNGVVEKNWKEIRKVYRHFKNYCCNQGNRFPLVFKNDKDKICALNGRLIRYMAPNVKIIVDNNMSLRLLGSFNLISSYIYINNRKYKLDFKNPKKMDLPIARDTTSNKYFICGEYPSVLDKYIDKDKLAQTIANVFEFEYKI